MLRVVTPTLGGGELVDPTPTLCKQKLVDPTPTLGMFTLNHRWSQRLKDILKKSGVSQHVRGTITTHTVEKHQIDLYVLDSSFPMSITPTREVMYKRSIVQQYNGPFPTSFKLWPGPAIVVAFRVREVLNQQLLVAGKELRLLQVDTRSSKPRISISHVFSIFSVVIPILRFYWV